MATSKLKSECCLFRHPWNRWVQVGLGAKSDPGGKTYKQERKCKRCGFTQRVPLDKPLKAWCPY